MAKGTSKEPTTSEVTRPEQQSSIFFVTPIGEQGSSVRQRADSLFLLLQEVGSGLGLGAIRADSGDQPGLISVRIVEAIQEASVIVADLVGAEAPNPNVMYELGLADAYHKHVVLITNNHARLPFDVRDVRALSLVSSDYKEVSEFKVHLRDSLNNAHQASKRQEDPVSIVTHAELRAASIDAAIESNTAMAQLLKEHYDLLDSVDFLKARVDMLAGAMTRLGQGRRSLRNPGGVELPLSEEFWSPSQEQMSFEPIAVDASLEAILKELKDRGIGRR